MNEATLPGAWVPGRFIPLHLKLMLSYLVLAAAVLGVSLAFAWREASDENTRSQTARSAETATRVRQDYDYAMERALAVVNLAAATPEMTSGIMSRGEVELGPGSDASPGGNSYDTTARYIAPPADYLRELGMDPTQNQPHTGVAIVGGKPAAVAVSPVTSGTGASGFIMISVDLSGLPSRVAGAGANTADTASAEPQGGGAGNSGDGSPSGTGGMGYFVIIGRDGNVTPLPADSVEPPAVVPVVDDPARLASGSPVTSPVSGANGSALTYYPLPGLTGWPVVALAIGDPAGGAPAAGKTNPLLGLAVLATAIGLFIAHILARTMSRPVERITEATELVAAGDISYQLPHQKGRDELSVLGESFNRMTQKYCSSQAEVEAAALRLEQTVIAQDAEIQTLFGISQAITSILDVNYLLEQVLTLSMPLVGSTRGAIWLADGPSGSRTGEDGEARGVAAGSSLGTDAGLRAMLMPAISIGSASGAETAALPADHAILDDLRSRGWKVAVLLPPESGPGASVAARQLFFERSEAMDDPGRTGSPLRSEELPLPDDLRVHDWSGGSDDTQVIVPLTGQKGFASGLMVMTVADRRPLSGHEALLIFNIAGLASVAVENAGLYGLAQHRGEQIETLLRESHHRITNNLAAISGMLSVQLARAGSLDAATVIRDNIARISSIAQVHRLLSGEMKDQVDATGMIRTICAPIVSSSTAAIELRVDGPPLVLSAKKATAVALIANELATNSVKHGFAGRESGNIDIAIAVDDEGVEIDYSDDGSGLSGGGAGAGIGAKDDSAATGAGARDAQGSPVKGKAGLGVQIVDSLVHDELNGEWEILPGQGYSVRIRFPQTR